MLVEEVRHRADCFDKMIIRCIPGRIKREIAECNSQFLRDDHVAILGVKPLAREACCLLAFRLSEKVYSTCRESLSI